MTPATTPNALIRPLRPGLILATAILVVAATYGLQHLPAGVPASHPATRPQASTAPASAGSSLVAVPDTPLGTSTASTGDLDKAIAIWSANVERDREDFISARNLALDYYTRGKLTGNVDDYARAQAATELGLSAYPGDAAGRTMRALLLYTLHDFAAARREAQEVYDADHGQLQALATTGDCALELGDYGQARMVFAELARLQPSAAVTARLARLASLEGRDAEAASLADEALRQARAEDSIGPSLAVYDHLRAFIAFQAGRLEAAAHGYADALKHWPRSYAAIEGLARVRAAQGRTDEAIALYRRAIAIVPQPEYLAGLGDLYALVGKDREAEAQYSTVRAIARLQARQAEVFSRQLVLFAANHGEDTAPALAQAEAELQTRKDVYGWDTYAWALMANGRAHEANAAIEQALALGTRDAILLYHAGVIAHAVGDEQRARSQLQAALDLNPGFDPLQAKRARELLAAIAAHE